MASYTSVFGGAAIPSSDNSYAAVALTADTVFFWPELATGAHLIADNMDVTGTAAYTMTLPYADAVSVGRAIAISNKGAFAVNILDAASGSIGSIPAGVTKLIWLTDNTTAAGVWTLFTLGAGTSAADASQLAGAGLTPLAGLLASEIPVLSVVADLVLNATHRAKCLDFTAANKTLTVMLASVAGSGFVVGVKNSTIGSVTLTALGSDKLDLVSSFNLSPQESCWLVSNGVNWLVLNRGQSTLFQFTKLVKDISPATSFVLTSAEASNKLMQFIGTATANTTITVPSVVAVYYIQNNFTNNGYTLTLKTAGGTGVVTKYFDRVVVYCDGIDVVLAQSTDAAAAAASALLSQGYAEAAASSEAACISYQNAAALSATLASQWAVSTSGQVIFTDYSAKAYAIGGTGVTSVLGSAKEWAVHVGGPVDSSEYSAKKHAQDSALSAVAAAEDAASAAEDAATIHDRVLDVAVIEEETFIATEGQTVFALATPYVMGINTLAVCINGLSQTNAAYSETSTNSITFVEGLAAGDYVEVRWAINEFINPSNSATTTYLPAGTGAVATDVQGKLRESVSVKDFGAIGDGVTDDTAAIQAAFNSAATEILFPTGTYIISNLLNDSTPALTSSVANRVIHGPGVISALSQVKSAIRITGDNTTVSLHIDGNNYIGYAINIAAENPTVIGCFIHDLNGFDNWAGIAIKLSFNGLDTSALITNNVIKNLQGVGNAIAGEGIGMQRAIAHSTDQNCTKTIFITNNIIEDVFGEEGDSVVVSASVSTSPYGTLRVPCVIANNTFNGWSRRAVKIACDSVVVSNNYFTNDLSVTLSSLQRVIDATNGSNITVNGNTFDRCKYQPQICWYLDSYQKSDNITITNNTIMGVGNTSISALIITRTYGANVTVQNNNINCPEHTVQAINVMNADNVNVSGNIINIASEPLYDFTGSTNVKVAGIVLNNSEDGYVIDVTSSPRAITLVQPDTTLSDGELISEIRCKQNDAAFPNIVTASIGFVAEGPVGNTGIGMFTGGGASPKVEKLRIMATGTIRPSVDGTQSLGDSSYRWAYVKALRVVTSPVAISALPAAATAGAGARAFVTDANDTGFAGIVAAGGANGVPVYSDGTNWRIG